jgi:hypothetical protein
MVTESSEVRVEAYEISWFKYENCGKRDKDLKASKTDHDPKPKAL